MAKFKAATVAKKSAKKNTSTPKAKITLKSAEKSTLSREQIEESIRLKAYELYLTRMGQNGNALNDWLKAEKLVLQAS